MFADAKVEVAPAITARAKAVSVCLIVRCRWREQRLPTRPAAWAATVRNGVQDLAGVPAGVLAIGLLVMS